MFGSTTKISSPSSDSLELGRLPRIEESSNIHMIQTQRKWYSIPMFVRGDISRMSRLKEDQEPSALVLRSIGCLGASRQYVCTGLQCFGKLATAAFSGAATGLSVLTEHIDMAPRAQLQLIIGNSLLFPCVLVSAADPSTRYDCVHTRDTPSKTSEPAFPPPRSLQRPACKRHEKRSTETPCYESAWGHRT